MTDIEKIILAAVNVIRGYVIRRWFNSKEKINEVFK